MVFAERQLQIWVIRSWPQQKKRSTETVVAGEKINSQYTQTGKKDIPGMVK